MKPFWNRALRRVALLAVTLATAAVHAATPPEIRVDYAYYSPESLVIKRFGWLDDEFRAERTPIKWVLSLGSNRALEFLNSGALDFGSTAGLAAVLARANGNPIRTVYVFSRPEWTALVVRKDSSIKTLADLKGKKIAATRGTDPFLFTLRALHTAGLTRDDVELVNLQHPDGRTALANGQVDAWAGLDPHMAAAQVEDGARLLYRNVAFNTYGFLNAREAFIEQYPQAVARVLKVYEKARQWIVAHPDDTAKLVADASKLPLAVAKLQLQRTDFSQPVPGAQQSAALKAAAPILVTEQLVKPNADLPKVVDTLIDPQFAQPVATAANKP
ncbi:aliphatic sulfonate ABC transporter substrate-binding protein [Burkholderia ubonensis]|uniref:aliphatic sulfonate ABC transporter substrate-binding protein n=1 Tax=Burkholderia ubonensis TaxID=101571 RepID=UPI000F5634B6|nr:aliphatic sulfonate ABC transporter substrate-binding protein [Burkholderia ubonensis]RQP33115.1 aliphatic sulfonate ABC transporter substrate-binding protein [Burkholderia ubonensis]RQP36656.1 aliphatic sulfonate ABC transporter substrate-binding protein [Burkholderia ubonensis]RQP36978.1 aliphatic sulfonate ABC transporter substrate-binding protein [Burkholderia ubonensis]RQP51685.1 aliphatic sulfonate ABC transporter substrate-binding protein [Burkholderia ubonensis]RQP56019.1 aliphatic 